MALLAAIIGLVLGLAAAELVGGRSLPALLCSAVAAVATCAVVSDVVAGANRRGGTAALVLIVIFVALVIAVITLFFAWFALLPAAGLLWLGLSRRRKASRKHAGLRVLR